MSSENDKKKPYLITGRGKDKCPADSFCLFADVEYNTSGDRQSILVIPAGATANNFSDYGFDQSGDGVSAVVNNTDKGNVLFNKIDQGGKQLPVPAKSAIADLTEYPLPESPVKTWNDQAQSALAYNEPVPVPVITAPGPDQKTEKRREPVKGTAADKVDKVELYQGMTLIGTAPVKDGKWTYTPDSDWSIGQQQVSAVAVRGTTRSGRAHRRFYVILPTPVVQIISPKDGATVDTKIPVDGVAFNAEKVELTEGSTVLGSVPVVSNRWSFCPTAGWTVASHTVNAVAVRGTDKSQPAKVGFTVATKNLVVTYKLRQDPWEDWETKKWIHSFQITLTAGAADVKRWRVGFGQLPPETVLYKQFTDSFWGMIIKDGSTGEVELGSPAKGTHIVPAKKSLSVDVQVLFASKDEANKKLYGLWAEDRTT